MAVKQDFKLVHVLIITKLLRIFLVFHVWFACNNIVIAQLIREYFGDQPHIGVTKQKYSGY